MIRVQYKPKVAPRKIVQDDKINMRVSSKLLGEFRAIVGENYQVKIRELMQMYIDAYKRKMNDKRWNNAKNQCTWI